MTDYQDERAAGLGYIKGTLDKLTNKQLDTYARMIQVSLENNNIKTKLGVDKPRNFLMGYIRIYADRMTNAQILPIVYDMMGRVEDNEYWKLYSRKDWQNAW